MDENWVWGRYKQVNLFRIQQYFLLKVQNVLVCYSETNQTNAGGGVVKHFLGFFKFFYFLMFNFCDKLFTIF